MAIYGKKHCQSLSGLQAGCWDMDEARGAQRTGGLLLISGSGGGWTHHLLGILSVSHSPGYTVRFLWQHFELHC